CATTLPDIVAYLPTRVVIFRQACRGVQELSRQAFVGLARDQTWCHAPLSFDLLAIFSFVQIKCYSRHTVLLRIRLPVACIRMSQLARGQALLAHFCRGV